MKKRSLLTIGTITALLLTGCQSDSNQAQTSETEALKEQIARLEQQVSALEQQNEAIQNSSSPTDSSADSRQEVPAADNQSTARPASSTTYTMDELSTMVDTFVTKAENASPSGTVSESTEQFFTLKQEEKQIDDCLDRHEDELESLYRNNSLTREEYKKLEHELERLEDKLDDAEDLLEYTFGIDD